MAASRSFHWCGKASDAHAHALRAEREREKERALHLGLSCRGCNFPHIFPRFWRAGRGTTVRTRFKLLPIFAAMMPHFVCLSGDARCFIPPNATTSRLGSLGKWMVLGIFDPKHEETSSFQQVSGTTPHHTTPRVAAVPRHKALRFSVEDNELQLLCFFSVVSFWGQTLSCVLDLFLAGPKRAASIQG